MKCKRSRGFTRNQYLAMVTFLAALASGLDPVVSQETVLWSFRGGSGVGPENTIEGMSLAFDWGAGGTEVDLWHAGVTIGPSVTPEIMLAHYRDISKTTDGSGWIQDLSPEYVRTLDAGNNGTTPFPGAKVPFFDEALNVMKARDKDILLHIKTSPFGLPGTVPTSEIAAALAEAEFSEDNIYTWDHDHTRIADYVAGIPGLKVIYQGDVDLDTVDWQELIDLGVKGIQIRLDRQQFGGGKFNQAYIDEIHSNGLLTFINDPNESEFRQAIDWGVNIVQSRRVDTFGQILDDLKTEHVPGDFDDDSDVDIYDINAYVGKIGAAAAGPIADLDLSGDGQITLADLQFHVENYVQTSNGQTGTFLGDLNRDGTVDVVNDAFILVSNLGGSATTYAQGDINLDGTVDVLGDAFTLIANLLKSND